MKTTLQTVTPVTAEDWLKKNKNNRNVAEKKLREYTDDMLQGRWMMNGESIKFDTRGDLLDGQHRLMAIVKSRTTQEMLVITGLPREVFDTIDNNAPRTAGNILEIAGLSNGKRVASALAVVLQYDRGVKQNVRANIPANRVQEHLETYPDLPEAIQEIGPKRALVVSRSVFDAYYYLFRRSDKVLASEYMEALRDGVGVDNMRAWLYLRERLIRASMSKLNKPSETHLAALLVKGWNFARRSNDVVKFGWAHDREGFPAIL